jgi:hypothetical protein
VRRCAAAAIGFVSFNALAATPNRDAKIFYDELEYEKCVQRLGQASKWDSTTRELAETELYLGLCTLHLGDVRASEDHFHLALRLDASVRPPSLVSPKVVDVFDRVKKRLEVSGRGEPTPSGSAPASDPNAVTTTRPPALKTIPAIEPAPRPTASASIPRSASPPTPTWRWGVVGLGAGAVASGSVGIYFGVQARRAESAANTAAYDSDRAKLAAAARGDALVANVSYGVAGAALVGAVVVWFLGGR